MIDHRNRHNHNLEYDRIRDLIHSKTSGYTKDMLQDRIKGLEELGEKDINTIT